MGHVRIKTLMQVATWSAAIIVGILAVFYAKLIDGAQEKYFEWFHAHKFLVTIFSPLGFLLSVFVVRKLAPHAGGSGIPQVLQAIELAKKEDIKHKTWYTPLISLNTAFIKILSSFIGILSGASIGREGPTVQIAASTFAWMGRRMHKYIPSLDFQTNLVAGAAAGVAAAFNTPIAGITFALEEIADGVLGPFKRTLMLTVIISGITSQSILGYYLYFGYPVFTHPGLLVVIPKAIIIGIVGGLLGGGFSRVLAYPSLTRLSEHWVKRALTCGVLCAIIGLLTGGDTAGSSYEITKKVLESGSLEGYNILFPILKLATTIFSYLCGMAGGIFSPCLSIGAGIGIVIAKISSVEHFQMYALFGMVSFFTGVIQAPLTAVIIVMEMTDEHQLILPLMIAAFIAQGIGRIIMPVPLYKFLAENRK